jgi:outer membrane protein assembly factor BamB
VGNVRRMAADLYAAGGERADVNDRGELRWVRAAAAIFGGQPVDPNYGWRITGGDGRYFGSLGRVRPADAATVALGGLAATAAFDAATGRTLWTRPHASVFCGQLRFDAGHPVLCALTGTFNLQTRKVTGLDVTVTGIDPATGTDRWRAHFAPLKIWSTTVTMSSAPQLMALNDLDQCCSSNFPTRGRWSA